jgi:hypothetical protein
MATPAANTIHVDIVSAEGEIFSGAASMVFARYAMATKWAENTGSTLRVALVARPEVVDPQKIGVLMMQNRGGSGEVFTNETDALAWLDSRLAPGERPGFAARLRTEE